MRCLRLLLLFLACAGSDRRAQAHPGPGIVVAPDGTVYFVHGPTSRIWRVSTEGEVSVLVQGSLEESFRVPHHLYWRTGELWTASDQGNHVWRIDTDGRKRDVFPHAGYRAELMIGRGGVPFALATDGAVITLGPERRSLMRVSATGELTHLAGGAAQATKDGQGPHASFGELHSSGMAWGPNEVLYLTDSGDRIRMVTMEGRVETLVRKPDVDEAGEPSSPQFEALCGLAVTDQGTVFAADLAGRRIWRVLSNGEAQAWAGSGHAGAHNAPRLEAQFAEPCGVALAPDGALFVLDFGWAEGAQELRIRRVPEEGAVTTLASVRPEVY